MSALASSAGLSPCSVANGFVDISAPENPSFKGGCGGSCGRVAFIPRAFVSLAKEASTMTACSASLIATSSLAEGSGRQAAPETIQFPTGDSSPDSAASRASITTFCTTSARGAPFWERNDSSAPCIPVDCHSSPGFNTSATHASTMTDSSASASSSTRACSATSSERGTTPTDDACDPTPGVGTGHASMTIEASKTHARSPFSSSADAGDTPLAAVAPM
mmetsp:Transcript_28246/g.86328  ORF Transcript_28246/g.86328 Transcript_28246/m.86328 type:complete len:220 (+) Transcript_28246:3650-4309(+)